MPAFLRYVLAPLAIAATVFTSAAVASSMHAGAAHPSAACPAGSHWDNITHSCIPNG